MRKLEHHHYVGLMLAIVLTTGPSAACEPPAGFINPPRPDIGPLEELMSHTERRETAQSLAAAMRSANRPLRIDATKDLAGVSGTYRLSEGPYGSVGARRLVCKTDGSITVEEVLLTESNSEGSRFRYVVWNYTSPKFRDVAYAVGEFVRTQIAPEKTQVDWTYRFALRNGLSAEEKSRFQKEFVDGQFAEWMRTQMDRKPDEVDPPTVPQ